MLRRVDIQSSVRGDKRTYHVKPIC